MLLGECTRKHVRGYGAGQVVFREGEAGAQMFLIHTGQIRITKQFPTGEQTVAMLGEGEFFGELAVLNGLKRNASALAEVDTQMVVVDSQNFDALMEENGAVAVKLVRKLAKRLSVSDALVGVLGQADASLRLVMGLHYEAEQFGQAGTKVGAVQVQQALAGLYGRLGLASGQGGEVLERLQRMGLLSETEGGYEISGLRRLDDFLTTLKRNPSSDT